MLQEELIRRMDSRRQKEYLKCKQLVRYTPGEDMDKLDRAMISGQPLEMVSFRFIRETFILHSSEGT